MATTMTQRQTGRAVLEFFLQGDGRADPYPLYRRLREEDPVHRMPGGTWLLTRYEDVAAALRNPALSSSLGGIAGNPQAIVPSADGRNRISTFASLGREVLAYAGVPRDPRPFLRTSAGLLRGQSEPGQFVSVVGKTLLLSDPPDHTRLRNLVKRAFTPRVVLDLHPRIEDLVDELIARCSGELDLISDFAYPLPLTIICEMLGVPASDQRQLIAWSRSLALGLDPIQAVIDPSVLSRADVATAEMVEYLTELTRRRRRDVGEDLISGLVAAAEGGDQLSDEEVVVTAALLLIAGHETTVNLIGNGLLALLRNPAQLERWREEPEISAVAVEELLRYDSPVQAATRRALEPFEVGGREIATGDLVMLFIGAANRDPDVFEQPDDLDLAREPNRHASFGGGIHYCLGAALARAEAQIAFPRLLARKPRLTVEDSELTWRPGLAIRGLKALPLRFAQ